MPTGALNLLHQGGQHRRSLGGLCALWAWMVLACMAAFSGLPAQAATGERVALLIGNARYSSGLPPLVNPPQDVAALEASLKKLGFRVQVLKDGDQKAMGRAIKQFGTQAQDAQVAFFYYSGHGMQAREENYLIPVGAGIESEADLDIEAVALRSLMRQIDEARPHNAVVVLDACRDNPVAARTKSASKGLSRINSQPTNTLVVFAALAGNTASDNGVFARALASHIIQPNLGLRGVFDNVNKAVRQASGNKQSIQRDDQLSEDVVLLASVKPEPEPVAKPILARTDPEDEAWQATKAANSAAAYDAYLAEFPAGRFASAARIAKAGLGSPSIQAGAAGGPAGNPQPPRLSMNNPSSAVIDTTLASAESLKGLSFEHGPSGVEFANGGMYVSGVYSSSAQDGASGVRFALLLPRSFDKQVFSIRADVLADAATRQVLTLGSSYRWLGLKLDAQGKLLILLNNFRHVVQTGLVLPTQRWAQLRVAVDLRLNRLGVMVDEKRFDGRFPPEAFPLDVIRDRPPEYDNVLTVSDYASGSVFKGYLKNLRVWPRYIEPAAL